MGQEARCTVTFGDDVSEGKALLETDHIVFRGRDLGLKITFKEMRSVEARDGELHIKFARGAAIFALGPQSEKWAHKILHPKSLIDKLGLKPGMKVSILGVNDPDFLVSLRERTDQVSFDEPRSNRDAILVAVETPEDVGRLAELKAAIKPDGAIWAVFRKGRKDFNENDVLRGGIAAGLVDVKVVRFSDTHTASKFVIRKTER
jgi:hypothetical protein